MWPIWTRLNNFLQFLLTLIAYLLNISLAGLKYLSKRKYEISEKNEKPHEILKKKTKDRTKNRQKTLKYTLMKAKHRIQMIQEDTFSSTKDKFNSSWPLNHTLVVIGPYFP